MNAPILKNRFIAAGLFDARSDTPLTVAQLRSLAPSIFAPHAHHSTSSKFRYYSTWEVLKALQDRGFLPVSARQGQSRDEDKVPFTRHLIRLRHESELDASGGEFLPEVCLLNAHDRTSSLRCLGGGYRPICRNGMIIASENAVDFRIPHSWKQIEDAIEATYRVIEGTRRVSSTVDRWRQIPTTVDQRLELATVAHQERFAHSAPTSAEAIRPIQFLEARREVDKENDLWTVFNRIQEQMMKGGQEGMATVERRDQDGEPVSRLRKVKTKPLNSINAELRHNAVLGPAAERMAVA